MEKLLVNYTDKWWILIMVIIVIIFIAIGFFINKTGYSTVFLFGVIGLSTALLFRTLDRQTSRIEKRIQHAEMELQAIGGLSKFSKTELPLNLGDWAISAHFLNQLVKEIYLREPELIVECGSGTSTLVSSSCLKDIGKGKVISLDHSNKYADETRNLLEVEKLNDWAHVVTAPLREYELDIGVLYWYGEEFRENINGKIDMLVVDGPPAPLQNLSRYPAVPLLQELLADECLIMLDDANRDEEKEIAKLWAAMLEVDIEFNTNCKGYAIIQK